MRRPTVLLPIAIVLFVLFGGEGPPLARADICPGCSSNSPAVNPFPLGALRWGTAKVKQGTSKCSVSKDDRLAIQRLTIPSKESLMRGYQLVVVDKGGKMVCEGLALVGLQIELNKNWEKVVIQRIAKTTVIKDPYQLDGQSPPEEFRPVYFLSAASAPDKSICTDYRPSSNRWYRRIWRKLFGRRPAADLSALVQPAKHLDDLFQVFADRLVEYAVVIPDAAYDRDGNPVDPSRRWRSLPPIPEAARAAPGRVSLEWFELACAGGALAHTDLSGLVDLEEEKPVRTAAVRMFLAGYRKGDGDTLAGTPVQYTRNRPYPSCRGCATRTLADRGPSMRGPIEAHWTEHGAVCLSHSRLWQKDTVITAARPYQGTLEEREAEFIRSRFGLPPCTAAHTGVFTTYSPNHIGHTAQFE